MISDPSVAKQVEMAHTALNVLRLWPTGFEEWLHGLRDAQPASTGVEDGWPIIRNLKYALVGSESNEVSRAIGEAVNSAVGVVPPRPGTRYAISSRRARVSEAHRLLCSRAKAGRLDSLSVAVEQVKARSRTFGIIDRVDIFNLKQRLESAYDLSEVGLRLGISRHQVKCLVKSGIVKSYIGIGARAGIRLIDPDTLDDLAQSLEKIATLDFCPHDPVSVADLVRLRSVSLDVILAAVFNGCLKIGLRDGRGSLLKRTICSRSHALETRRQGHTVREAARCLNVAVRQIPILIGAGCLVKRGAGKSAGIDRASISKFGLRFATGQTLASRFKTNTAKIAFTLRAAGMVPVVPGDSQQGISSVWSLDDALNVLSDQLNCDTATQTSPLPIGEPVCDRPVD